MAMLPGPDVPAAVVTVTVAVVPGPAAPGPPPRSPITVIRA
jgi:hypothetical protein